MGSIRNETCSYGQEIKMRVNACRSARKEIGALTNSKHLSSNPKLHLVKAFGFSRLFYNVASIPFWPKGSLKVFSQAYCASMRAALLKRDDDGACVKSSHADLFKKLKIFSFDTHWRAHRLRYFCRFVLHAPCLLRHLVEYESSLGNKLTWSSIVVDDLKWLLSYQDCLSHLGDPSEPDSCWFDFIFNESNRFRACIAKACKASILRPCIPHEPIADVVELPPGSFVCAECDGSFQTIQELSAHCFCKHQVKAPLREEISDIVCCGCLKDLHTRTKVHHHVAYRSPRCRSLYDNFPVISNELYDQMELAEGNKVKALKRDGISILYSCF